MKEISKKKINVIRFQFHPKQYKPIFLQTKQPTTITMSSFLTWRTVTRATRAPATSFAPRAFSTTFVARKSATESVKDGVKTVDRKVSDVLVEGIEVGQTAAQKAKEVAGMSSSEMKGKANEVAGEAKGKANEVAGEAKGKANELAGEAKGKKEELKGKM